MNKASVGNSKGGEFDGQFKDQEEHLGSSQGASVEGLGEWGEKWKERLRGENIASLP